MIKIVKRYFEVLFSDASISYRNLFNEEIRKKSILSGFQNIKILDLGCGTGENTLKFVEGISNIELYGIELIGELVKKSSEKGIKVIKSRADNFLPLDTNSFDIVLANQVIEHLNDQDIFLEEIYRVLRPGGILLLCTDNLSSWHNVVALFMGWQPFPMTNFSRLKAGIGNPIALHRGEHINLASMLHTRLFTKKALGELVKLHHFQNIEISGAGYYPFSGKFARVVSKIDSTHAAYQFIKAVK